MMKQIFFLLFVCTTSVQSFVSSPWQRLFIRSSPSTTTSIAIANNAGDGSGENEDNGTNNQNSPSRFMDRRESLAHLIVAPVVVLAYPSMARASTGTQTNNKSGATKTPKDTRPSLDLELSNAVQRLLDLDAPNRLVPGRDYAIETQGTFRKVTNGEVDAAPSPLFRFVDPSIFRDRPTYRTFVTLLDNYQSNVCSAEDDTNDEQEEAKAFLRACMATPVMQYCFRYCKARLDAEAAAAAAASSTANDTATKSAPKYSFETEEDFVKLLYKIWFKLYSRSRDCGDSSSDNGNGSGKKVNGSSGFEHVFVGEIRNGQVIGFHNWIQIYLQETIGRVDYCGSIARGGAVPSNTSRVLTYNLRWNGAEKYVGTSFIGVSPEFELALYTMTFLVGKKDNLVRLRLDDDPAAATPAEAERIVDLDVKCFQTKGKVGSCFVESVPT